MIPEANLVIAHEIERSQRANLEYATQLVEFGREFLRRTKKREVTGETIENVAEAMFTGLLGGNMRSVRRAIRETEIKERRGILTPLDHDALYSVIRGILQERGW